MRALCERIDQVRSGHSRLATRMKLVGNEIPSHAERSAVMALSEALEQNVSSEMLVSRFPDFCWLLTLRSSYAVTEGLGLVLEQSAFRRRNRRRNRRAVAYPLLLIILVGMIFVAACFFIVPEYEAIFRDFELSLPTATQWVIEFSRFLRNRIVIVVAILVSVSAASAIGLWGWIGSGRFGSGSGQPRSQSSSRSRESIHQSQSKAALQLAELIDDHVSTPEAVAIASQSCGNPRVRAVLDELASRLSKRTSSELVRPQHVSKRLPANLQLALSQTPVNTALLRELSATYRELSYRHRSWISYLIGPLAVVGIGLVIAFILLTLFAPLISLVSSLSS